MPERSSGSPRFLQAQLSCAKRNLPDAGTIEDYWRTYFASIFDPARLEVGTMRREMPKKYWHNLADCAAHRRCPGANTGHDRESTHH
jgi:hypothetical protein